MTNALLGLLAISLLAAALGGSVLLHRWGLATTYVRDLLHIGAGVWIFAWPWFDGVVVPLVIVILVAGVTVSVPSLARRSTLVARVHDTFAAGDERWSGLSWYTLAFAVFTALGLLENPFPAAAGLLALCLGDGMGGFVGRRFGVLPFRAPGGKQKSVEGSLTVALAATFGVLLASWRFGNAVPWTQALGLGFGAAAGEALAPRGTDNIVVPTLVWGLAESMT